MKTQVRLNSVVPNGVGGPEVGAINLIYSYLLDRYKQSLYNYISINQINEDLQEFVMKEHGKSIHVNIRTTKFEDFERSSVAEKNRIRLDIIHEALLRIADYDKKLDRTSLEAIKGEILSNDFLFDIRFKQFINKKDESLAANIMIRPEMDKFEYYVTIEQSEKIKCRIHLYTGITNIHYVDDFFKQGKWNGINDLIISGKSKQVDIHIKLDKCELQFVNLTPYEKPPLFEMFRTDISENDKQKATENWRSSLPHEVVAVLDLASES